MLAGAVGPPYLFSALLVVIPKAESRTRKLLSRVETVYNKHQGHGTLSTKPKVRGLTYTTTLGQVDVGHCLDR